MNTTHGNRPARHWAAACLLAHAAWLTLPAHADDWAKDFLARNRIPQLEEKMLTNIADVI